MLDSTVTLLLSVAGVSASGVMAPGPVTAAALAAGARSRHAGALIALGHGIVEFPLMLLIMAGASVILQMRSVRIGIGLVGGSVLVLMGVQMLLSSRRTGLPSAGRSLGHPIWAGVILTGGNPYFLLWWATAGLTLATRAVELGALAFGLFAVVHWFFDLVWLEILSLASFKGTRLLGPAVQKVILIACGLAMVGFGAWFAFDAGRSWIRGVS